MNKTILITGASSGIGHATVLYFSAKGWNVVATMRNIDKQKEFSSLGNVLLLQLDVTKKDTIVKAFKDAILKFGKIDVIVNNAGYGLMGPFELLDSEQILKQYETNVFGLMNVIKEALSYFRENKTGTIINISSVGGRLAIPLYSLYSSSKWAIEGFSESLQFELKQFNIKVKLVEPGPIKTDFYNRSADKPKTNTFKNYEKLTSTVMPKLNSAGYSGLEPIEVAKVIYKAANSDNYKLRYGVGSSIKFVLFLRKITPDFIFNAVARIILVR